MEISISCCHSISFSLVLRSSVCQSLHCCVSEKPWNVAVNEKCFGGAPDFMAVTFWKARCGLLVNVSSSDRRRQDKQRLIVTEGGGKEEIKLRRGNRMTCYLQISSILDESPAPINAESAFTVSLFIAVLDFNYRYFSILHLSQTSCFQNVKLIRDITATVFGVCNF